MGQKGKEEIMSGCGSWLCLLPGDDVPLRCFWACSRIQVSYVLLMPASTATGAGLVIVKTISVYRIRYPEFLVVKQMDCRFARTFAGQFEAG